MINKEPTRIIEVTLNSGAFLQGISYHDSEFNGWYHLEVHQVVVCSPANPRKMRYRGYLGRIQNAHNSKGHVQVLFGNPKSASAFVPVEDLVPYRLWIEKYGKFKIP